MKVLIVDDSKLGRAILKELLENLGHSVVAEAKNGEEGISMFKKFKPRLIITDIEMPIMDGITMAAKICAHNSMVKIIVVSAVANKKVTQKALLNGVSTILTKPIDKNQFYKVINACAEAQ